MASSQPRRIDIDEAPDLATIAAEVQATGEPTVLTRNGEDVAMVTPLPRRRKRTWPARPVTEDDSIFRIVGMGKSGIPGGMSGRKHELLKKV